jgi:hypothetical protein
MVPAGVPVGGRLPRPFPRAWLRLRLQNATETTKSCSMLRMKRSFTLIAAVFALGAALAPASAAASVIELGATSTPLVAPSCPAGVSPADCKIILTQVTALETIRDGVAYPTTVKKAGSIVAFTIGLSRLASDAATAKGDIHFLDQTYGGTTRAAITVLRPSGPKKNRQYSVVGESPVFHLQPYLGQVVQFPLLTSLPVLKGDVVGLTIPTWAPVLSIQLPSSKFAYRQSRARNCGNPPSTTQAQNVKQVGTYKCDYPGTRVEYSATEVTTPVAQSPIHLPRR